MPSNIATGIGLSGQLQVDNSGQQNRLAAEQAAAQQRLKDQAAKKKADDALLKDIASNTIFSKTMIQPRNQADAESRLTQGLADIVKTIGEGDGNVAVSAYSKLNQLSQEINTLAQVDKKQTEIWTEAFKKPEQYRDYFRPVEINGKTYNNAWEAYNKGEDLELIANAWGGTEHVVMDNEVLGGKMYMPNPQATIGAFEAVLPSIKDEMFTTLNEGDPITGPGDETFIPLFSTIGPNEKETLVSMALNNPAVVHNYELEMKKDRTFTGKRDAQFNQEIDRRIREDLEAKLPTLQKQRGIKTFTPKTTSTSESGAKYKSKKAEVFLSDEGVVKAQEKSPWEANSETGKKYQYLAVAPIQNVSGALTMNIDIKAGTLYWDKEEKTLRAPKNYESTEKVVPHEMVVMSDGKKNQPYIRFLLAVPSESDKQESSPFAQEESTEDKFKTRSMESFYVPATRENLDRLSTRTEIPINDWLELRDELETRASQGRTASSAGPSGNVVQSGTSGTGNNENSSTEKSLTGQDKAAYDWAKSNPNNPRSKEILKRLGLK